MMVANLTLLVALGLGQAPDPSDLVAGLGAARYADREAAAAALEKLGAEAVPALREGVNSRDAEIRSRASALLDKIDAELMTRPTLVKLDFENQPLDEVIKTLNTQMPFVVQLEPDSPPLWKSRKLTLHESEPIPFWKALDRLCQAGGLQSMSGPPMMVNGHGPTVRLMLGVNQVFPTSDSGPFRVTLQSVHLHRDLTLATMPQPAGLGGAADMPANQPAGIRAGVPGLIGPRPVPGQAVPKGGAGGAALPEQPAEIGQRPGQVPKEEARPAPHADLPKGALRLPPPQPPLNVPGPGVIMMGGMGGLPNARSSNEQFFVQLQVVAEPRLMLVQSQDLKLIEAVDDRGQSLLQPTAGRQTNRVSGYMGYAAGAFIQLPIHLKLPAQPGTVIKKLRGELPVTVSARKPEPVVISLKPDAIGKPIRNGDVTITVHEVNKDPNNQRTAIDVSLQELGSPADPGGAPGAVRADFAQFRMPNMAQNQLEVVDADGKVLQSYPSTTRMQPDEVRMTLTLLSMPGAAAGAPAQIRYYNLTRTVADVPFEFTDVPIP